jgi:signal transduction histidine kinase
LADNAAKYSPAGAPVEIGSARRGGELVLWVQDRGEGLDDDEQREIFRRFSRLERHSGHDGTGLGLAIVSAIARAHQGRATVSSVPGIGTRFSIRVPIHHREEARWPE